MRRFALAIAFLSALSWTAAGASEVRILRLDTREALLQGSFSGVSIDELGTLTLGAEADRIVSVGEPFVLSAATHPEGWVLGTGNAGKVILVRRDGTTEEIFSAPEAEIFAVLAEEDGTVYAGSSPDGKVYRIDRGDGEEHFDPDATYIWDLDRSSDGGLLVATGTEGKLFEVDANGRGRLLWDSEDTHVRAVKSLAGGDVVAGTAGTGLIVRIAEGRVRALYDAPQPEIVDLAAGRDGAFYAAAVASEASAVQLGRGAGSKEDESESDAADDEDEEGAATVIVVEDDETPKPVGTRPPGFKGVRSEVLRFGHGGDPESVARFEDETVHSLLELGDRLWIGTGLEGKLFSSGQGLGDHRDLVLESDLEERQIVALVPDGSAGHTPVVATTNAAALYELDSEGRRRGVYTSPALDADVLSRFGVFRWRGATGEKGSTRFSFRSGIAASPDQTWSEWTDWREGDVIPLDDLPEARYVQWRVEMSAPGETSPSLSSAELSYRQQNLPPRITELEILDPGEILVSYKFNPAEQVFEPSHPNKDRIFTTLEPSSASAGGSSGSGSQRLKRLWKHGYRTLRWEAVDPNDDDLRFGLSFRPENPGEEWYPMAEELEGEHFSFDASVLPDGVYRFRLVASDRGEAARSAGHTPLVAERVSGPVIIDGTPPRVDRRELDGERLTVEVSDAASPLREAVYSVDAAEWRPATVADGLLDGRSERLFISVPEEARFVILRLVDTAHNGRTVALLDRSAER